MATFSYFDEEFDFSDEVDPFAITEFAEALDNGIDAEGLRGLAVAWRLALSCVAEADQDRFRRLSRKNKATAEAYLRVFRERLETDTERPTGSAGDSSAGPEPIKETSAPAPAASVTSLPARPDLALAASRMRSA